MPLRAQKSFSRTVLATGLTAVLCVGLAVGTLPRALADGGARSQVKLKTLTSAGAKGVVRSGRASCRRNREVSIHRRNGFFWEKIDTTTTSRSGRWKIGRRLRPAKYFAKVESTRGCRYDVSQDKRLR